MKGIIAVVGFAVGLVLTTVLMMAGLACGISAITYSVDNVPLTVWQDNKVIYQGPSACVETRGAGDTTRVDIKQGLWCMWPKAYYVGRGLRVEGSK